MKGSSKPPDNYNFQLSPANGVKPVTPKQQRLCRRYPELVPYIGLGAKFSISQCQYQFKNRRWNCSAQNPENVFGKIVKIGKISFIPFFSPAVLSTVSRHLLSKLVFSVVNDTICK